MNRNGIDRDHLCSTTRTAVTRYCTVRNGAPLDRRFDWRLLFYSLIVNKTLYTRHNDDLRRTDDYERQNDKHLIYVLISLIPTEEEEENVFGQPPWSPFLPLSRTVVFKRFHVMHACLSNDKRVYNANPFRTGRSI